VLYYPQGTSWRVRPRTWGGLPWWCRFQALRYQGCYRTELLPSLTAEWLERSPPNIGVNGLNPHGLKRDNWKGYIGGWIYPEYLVAWMIPVVGFDCWQYSPVQYSTVQYSTEEYSTVQYSTVQYIIQFLKVMYLILTLQVPLTLPSVFDRPGVAGAVLQTASSLTHWLIKRFILFLKYLHNIINQKR
jgi:hypothetical protein